MAFFSISPSKAEIFEEVEDRYIQLMVPNAIESIDKKTINEIIIISAFIVSLFSLIKYN